MINNYIPEERTEEERKVLELENRRIIIEASLYASSEAKKKLLIDAENLSKEIEANKDVLSKIKIDIISNNNLLVESKNAANREKTNHEELIQETINYSKGLEDFKLSIFKQKENILAEYKGFEKENQNKKYSLISDIKDKKDTLDILLMNIKNSEAIFVNIQNEIKTESEKSNKLKDENDKLNGTLESFKLDIISCKNEIHRLKNEILISESKLNGVNSDILIKQEELKNLEDKISTKSTEYDVLKQKAFGILKREEILISQEGFIRDKFKQAGVPFND